MGEARTVRGISKYFELTNPEFYKITGRLMLPVILQQLISIGINFFDNIMIGGLGEAAISAVSLSNQYYGIFQMLSSGLGSGAAVLAAQYWGKGDRKSLKHTATIGMQVSVIICAFFTIITVWKPQMILGLLTNQPDIIESGITYMRLLGTTFLFTGISSISTFMLRSTGIVHIPLIGSGLAFAANIFFNWVFIFGKFGAPALGIVGAGIGTCIARVIEFIVIFFYFILADKNTGYRLRDFFGNGGGLWKTYLKFAFPIIITDAVLGVSLSIVSAIYGHVGSEMAAAVSIVNSVVQILTVLNMAMGGAAAVLVGNTIGKGDLQLAKRQGNSFIVMAVMIGLVVIPILALIEQPYYLIYTVSPETLVIAHKIMLCNFIFVPLQNMTFILTRGVMRGGGDSTFLSIADNTLVWLFSIPIGIVAAFVWRLDAFWIYFLIRSEYPLKGFICLVRYMTGKWIKRI